MILIKDGDIFLKPKIALYNNIAHSGKCRGRLLAELEVFPLPRIVWEFESLGDSACEPADAGGVLTQPLIGYGFRIDKPYITNRGWGSLSEIGRVTVKGGATQAFIGDPNLSGQSFYFLLPNARFQEENFVGQGKIDQAYKAKLGDEEREFDGGTAGRFVVVPIDDDWQIHLETRQEALHWLDNKRRNIGTYITTLGRLYQKSTTAQNKPNPLKSISLQDAIHKLWSFSLLLSFCNGGYLGPLYVEGFRKSKKPKFAATVLAFRTTPLEQLGSSWLTLDSDLIGFLSCMTAFERMEKLAHWQEEFDLVLSWYFQAIQPQTIQTGKPWPVVANAIGAVLEKLSYIILDNELGISGLKTLRERVTALLEQMGIAPSRGFDDENHVKTFVDIRNDATHALRKSALSDRLINQTLERAILWVEETLLWRLGYAGKYRNRLASHYESIGPRYDLSKRKPEW